MKLNLVGIVLALLLISLEATAQLKIYPIKSSDNNHQKPRSQARTSSNTLSIPFWDDFSTAGSQPDTAIWQNSQNVFISPGLGIQPPSINVASFDGLQSDGSPYSSNPTSEGETDALITCPIDLTSFAPVDDIYLSFFYQFAGLGEVPDETDSIRVEFMNADSVWVPVWPRSGESLNRTGDFEQILLAVDDATFFHEAFRFKFQAFGRQSGPFDIWTVDYIYINAQRSSTIIGYPDRTFVSPFTSVLTNYTSIPRAHFNGSLMEGTTSLVNLDDDESQPYSVDTNIDLINYLDSMASVSSFSATEQDVGDAPDPGVIDTVSIPNIIPESAFSSQADSTILNFKITMNVDDSQDADTIQYPNFSLENFNINNVIENTFKLKDYYAYDDGTAEVGAGLNFSGNRLAYQYEKLGDSVNFITGFDIYFPFVSESPNGKSIDLIIWSDIDVDSTTQNVLYRETITISTAMGLNRFTRFELQNSILVEDSIFYIGYRQNTSGDLAIGLDKNNDTGSKMFFNLTGTWTENENVKGSLMLRPIFGGEASEVVGLPEIAEERIRIYPNPTRDILYINELISNFEVVSIDGRSQHVESRIENNRTAIEMKTLPTGIYLLKFIKNGKFVSKKIIKQ